ncbi:hypothetical protein Tco_1447259, partial [Tanacetum coccineum]
MEKEVNDRNVTFRLHYGGVLVRGLVTKYRDFDYVNIEREHNRVRRWSFTADLRGLGFKDEDVNGLYYRQLAKTLTNGLRLINDEFGLYEIISCTSRTGLVELYVEHSEDWLRANNKLVDTNVTTWTTNVSATCEAEGDVEGDCFGELDTINETLDPNQDTEVAESMEIARNHYKVLNQITKLPFAQSNKKELIRDDEDEDNVHDGEENYLDKSNVESLNEEILEDGTTDMMRTCVKFPRCDENCKTVSFLLGQSFTDELLIYEDHVLVVIIFLYGIADEKLNLDTPYPIFGYGVLTYTPYPFSWIRSIDQYGAMVFSSSKSLDMAYASRMIRRIDVGISD